ncbi:MAG: bifunctional NADH dehydrogenase FAD-containing subunit/selenide, water dikinase SelD, partial [Gammaproteobacteria bacterium]|nr:bifunctional NADH dehydrogenase FAD-containing subunit/selenide, water dikinase SelD [Gammaproteobacteria bacterium]
NSNNTAAINMDELPLIEGALNTLNLGIVSTLHPQNERFSKQIEISDKALSHTIFPLLFDPQTSGGLLGAIPAEQADSCLADLIAQGYESSRIIGTVVQSESEEKITLRT